MAVAGRFDLEEARREAQAAKRAARIRSIVSNVTLVVVLLAVAIGGKIGWDKWQERREAERAAAEAAQIAEEKARAEQQRAADAKAKALAEKREAERKALEEKREAERKAREEAREREKREREEARVREEERRHAEAEFRAAQQELKKFEDAKVSMLDFRPETYVCFEYGLEKAAKISVDESKWGTLAAHSERRRTAEFLEMLRDDSVTNVISDTCYPDRATFDHLLENLDAERFTLVVNLDDDARDRKLVLVAADKEKGLAAPEGMRALKAGGKISGWTVPFAYGDKIPFFLLEQATALQDYVEGGGVLLAICGGFQILGCTWLLGNETVPGLGILDIETKRAKGGSHNRLVGNVALESPLAKAPVVGYENHAGRTFLGDGCEPFGRIIDGRGEGNNGRDGFDGARYRNVVATYLHGPLLAKNPEIADWLIEKALARRAAENGSPAPALSALDDRAERAANAFMCAKLGVRAR